jgi:hypothetical protein
MNTRDVASAAALALIITGAATCRGRDQNQNPPAAAQQASAAVPTTGGTQAEQSGDLVCVAYCAPDQPGTPVAEIKWVVGNQPSASEIRRTAIQQNVDVAVNEDGFERGRFARLQSVNPQARFAPAGGQRAGAPQLPGLGDLSVRAVTSSQEPAGAMRLATPAEGGQENVVLQVQGLRPGLNYYWRVRASTPGQTQTVMCRAPVCPTDRRNR